MTESISSIVQAGRLPVLFLFSGMIVGFAVTRLSVRLIRAGVRWWPGNVETGGLHIHHVVFGVAVMVIAGIGGFAVPEEYVAWRCVLGALFGVGIALVLDEFALILHLRDVYWSEEGRLSVDAIFVAVAATGLIVAGIHPVLVDDIMSVAESPREGWQAIIVAILFLLGDLVLAVVVLLKGKIWTGLVGLFLPMLLVVGAIRLARPRSPWARWRYRTDSTRGARRLARAKGRERRWRQPITRTKVAFQELIAGRHQ